MSFMEIISLVQSSAMSLGYYVAVFVLVLSVLVFVHEWGHYIVARLCGVRVKVFSIGFGKELIGINDSHGTRWKISLIPLGGYVQLFGDTDPASTGHTDMIEDEEKGEMRKMTDQEKKDAFFSKPVWKRALVVAAGPAINYLFAIVLLSGLYVFSGQSVTPPVGAAVVSGSSAQEAKFMPHDKILSVDGKEISTFNDIRREMMIALDQEKHFVIERGGEVIDIYAAPKRVTSEDHLGFEHSRGVLGLISPAQGIKIDRIVEIAGREYSDEDKTRQALLKRMGTSFEIGVKSSGDKVDRYVIQPDAEYNKAMTNAEDKAYGVLYLSNTEAREFVKYAPHVAVYKATVETYVITRGIVEALGQIIMGVRSANELGGVIRIGAVAGDMAQQGLIALIILTAMLSVNLGFINLLPIPVLDGGHLLFYAFEAALGKPVPYKIQEYAFNFGMIFLVGVMAFTNLNDVVQIFS